MAAAGPGPGARVGIVAGRAVGAAVARNRAKRRIRGALERVPLRGEEDYVVIASPQVNDVEFHELVDWLAKAATGEGET